MRKPLKFDGDGPYLLLADYGIEGWTVQPFDTEREAEAAARELDENSIWGYSIVKVIRASEIAQRFEPSPYED